MLAFSLPFFPSCLVLNRMPLYISGGLKLTIFLSPTCWEYRCVSPCQLLRTCWVFIFRHYYYFCCGKWRLSCLTGPPPTHLALSCPTPIVYVGLGEIWDWYRSDDQLPQKCPRARELMAYRLRALPVFPEDPGLGSQHTQGSLQPPVTPASWDLTPLPDSVGTHTHVEYTDRHVLTPAHK